MNAFLRNFLLLVGLGFVACFLAILVAGAGVTNIPLIPLLLLTAVVAIVFAWLSGDIHK